MRVGGAPHKDSRTKLTSSQVTGMDKLRELHKGFQKPQSRYKDRQIGLLMDRDYYASPPTFTAFTPSLQRQEPVLTPSLAFQRSPQSKFL